MDENEGRNALIAGQTATAMHEAALAMKEMYDSLTAAGFSENQACIVVAHMVTGVGGPGEG